MKLLLPIALLASAAAAADCKASDIVEACLASEQAKLSDCGEAAYECKCAAQQAIATCYNNCPDDSRAADAQGQVQIHCDNASVFGSSSTAPTKSADKSDDAPEPTTTSDSDSKSDSDSDSSDELGGGDSGGAAGELVFDMGGLLLGVAGVMAVVV